jgi:undecaprenyl phosphate-alpha-L-ara4FN deformylase
MENSVLTIKMKMDNILCRGRSIFRPLVDGIECTPQIPVTLPTYDEIIGTKGITEDNYNVRLLSLVKPDDLNVLTIHAEVEGMSTAGMFNKFLGRAVSQNFAFESLGNLLPQTVNIPAGGVAMV